MKITTENLRRIIREELSRSTLKEEEEYEYGGGFEPDDPVLESIADALSHFIEGKLVGSDPEPIQDVKSDLLAFVTTFIESY
ncbi:MAG: hypothetical protein ACW96N_03950 [Candidatus Thorarchaeota archaeon]